MGTADHELCEGFGNCTAASPRLFDIGRDGKVKILPTPTNPAEAEHAMRACPVGALRLVER